MNETMYQRIKRLRIEQGLTQKELAEKVGYSGKDMISRVEAGKVDIARDRIMRFAAALDVSPTFLFIGSEPVSETDHNVLVNIEDVDHIEKYHKLDAEDRARIDERIQILLESDKYRKKGQSETA